MPADRELHEHTRLDEARLVLRAQLGDREAVAQLITQTLPWLRSCLYRLMAHDSDADDAAQDVLLIVFRKLALLDEPRAYRAWVYRTASRQALALLRKRGRLRPLIDAEMITPAPEPTPIDREELARIESGILRLTPNTRAVVDLHYYEGLSIAQTAAVLEIPEGTSKSRLAAGLAALRRSLAKDDA